MFIHLHNHSIGSYSDSLIRIEDGVRRIAELGQPAAAITDHGNLSFIVDFYNACRRYGVKHIIGCECYFVDDARRSILEKNPYRNHLILLAKDNDGLKNLISLNNESWLENSYYEQRGLTDWKLLEKYHTGLIAMTACYWGSVPQKYVCSGLEEAKREYARYYDIFGEDFYPEVGRHGVAEEERANEGLQKLAAIFGSKPVLTNDVHYLKQEDWIIHDVLIKTRFGFASNFKVDAQNFYLKSAEEMARLGFPPSYMATTLEIAEKCNIDLDRFKWAPSSGDEERYIWVEKLDVIDARQAIEATASVLKADVRDLLDSLPPEQRIDAALETSPAFRKKAKAFPTLIEFARGMEGIPRRAEPDPHWLVKVGGDLTIPVRIAHGVIVAQFTKETLRAIGKDVKSVEALPALLPTSKKLTTLERAATLTRKKRYREAREAITELHDKEPENIDYVYKIATTYYLEGSYSRAVQWFKHALDLKGSKAFVPEISVRLAWCCRRLNDREGSIKWFRAVLDSKPHYPQALYGLGVVYFLDNEYREAEKYMKQFLKTNPPDAKREKAERMLATMERRTKRSN